MFLVIVVGARGSVHDVGMRKVGEEVADGELGDALHEEVVALLLERADGELLGEEEEVDAVLVRHLQLVRIEELQEAEQRVAVRVREYHFVHLHPLLRFLSLRLLLAPSSSSLRSCADCHCVVFFLTVFCSSLALCSLLSLCLSLCLFLCLCLSLCLCLCFSPSLALASPLVACPLLSLRLCIGARALLRRSLCSPFLLLLRLFHRRIEQRLEHRAPRRQDHLVRRDALLAHHERDVAEECVVEELPNAVRCARFASLQPPHSPAHHRRGRGPSPASLRLLRRLLCVAHPKRQTQD
mmetsp:Transcript_16360/g.63860  ORF Transcript_16360/g.63860 Transcript_16360/m.63860 type:complete len:296 (-) Transcript_16360:134-1021(-)